MTNVNLLKSRLIVLGYEDFTTAISEMLNISYSTASAKLNNKRGFKQSEISILAVKLGLNGDELKEIFVDGVNESDSN